jgi:ATP-dependent helicase HrpB
MLEGIRTMGLDVLPWSREAVAFRARSEWLRTRRLVPEDWPDLSEGHLLALLPAWLGPFLGNVSRRAHLASLDLAAILRARFSFRQLKELDRLAPEAVTVPTGSRIRLDYASGDQPVLAVRLQEMFGQSETPAVGGGDVNVLLHLLSPAGRPLAVTQDLPSFWRNAYPEVRKQMRGRYPKHVWPEDPAEARPTKRTKGGRRQ